MSQLMKGGDAGAGLTGLGSLFRQFVHAAQGGQASSSSARLQVPSSFLSMSTEEKVRVRGRTDVMARQFFPGETEGFIQEQVEMFMNNFDVAGGASFGGGSATDAAARNVPQEELIDGAAWEMAQSEEEWLSQVGTNQEFQEELQAMIAPRDNAPHPYQYVNNSDELEAVVAQNGDLLDSGVDAFMAGDYQQAVLRLEAATLQDGNNAEAWRMLGAAHAETEDDFRARSALARAVEVDPENLDALFELGVSSINEAERPQGLKYLLRWFERHPVYNSLLDPEEEARGPVQKRILDAAERAMAEVDANDPDLHNLVGVLCNSSKDFDRALVAFERAVELDPENYVLWNRLGATHTNGFSSAEAIRCYQQSLRLKKSYCRGWSNLGIAFMTQKCHKDAAKCFMRSLCVYPKNPQLWFYLALALNGLRRFDLIKEVEQLSLTMDVERLMQLDLDSEPDFVGDGGSPSIM